MNTHILLDLLTNRSEKPAISLFNEIYQMGYIATPDVDTKSIHDGWRVTISTYIPAYEELLSGHGEGESKQAAKEQAATLALERLRQCKWSN